MPITLFNTGVAADGAVDCLTSTVFFSNDN